MRHHLDRNYVITPFKEFTSYASVASTSEVISVINKGTFGMVKFDQSLETHNIFNGVLSLILPLVKINLFVCEPSIPLKQFEKFHTLITASISLPSGLGKPISFNFGQTRINLTRNIYVRGQIKCNFVLFIRNVVITIKHKLCLSTIRHNLFYEIVNNLIPNYIRVPFLLFSSFHTLVAKIMLLGK